MAKRMAPGIMLPLLLMSMLTVAFSVVPAEATSLDPPIHVHLTWQDETNTTMTVTWQTSTSTAGDNVLYDTVSRNGVPASYSYSAAGFNYTYSGASGYIHDVELTDLTPDTVYYFICGGDTGGWSSERAFRTAPSVSSDVRFVVGGDSRSNIAEREKISRAMAEFNPAFVMHSGDMVNDGRVQSQWDSWFADVDSGWIGENNLTIPIIPAVGNHEVPQDADSKYFVQLALPGNERWYSYNWGPDIHIICLDSETSASGAQRDWLENDLATHVNYTWKFVLFHRPPFVSGHHSPFTPALTYWVPLFDEYHVDIVFNGHEHSYQRSHPLNWTASQTEPQDYSNGTMYVVSGGWGAPLYDPKPIWYMAYQSKAYHFCLVDVFKNGTLHLQAKDNQGNTFDEVTIYKPVADATIDISPGTLNLKSKSKWITAYVELPEGHNVNDIDVHSILLNGTIPVDVEAPVTVGDYDFDSVPDLMVKFDRATIVQWLDTVDHDEGVGRYCEINLTVTGTAIRTQFSGTDRVKVLRKLKIA